MNMSSINENLPKLRNKKSGFRILLWLVAAMVFIAIGLVMSYIYMYSKNNYQEEINNNQEENNNQDDNENNQDNDNEDDDEENYNFDENYKIYEPKSVTDVNYNNTDIEHLAVDSALVKQLYSYVTVYGETFKDLHLATKLTKSNVATNYKFYLVFLQFVDDNLEYCEQNGLTISKSAFKAKYEALFGETYSKIDWSYSELEAYNITEINDNYVFKYDSCFGATIATSYKIIKAQKNGNELYIYDNYFYQVPGDGGGDGVCADSECKVVLMTNTEAFYDEYSYDKTGLYLPEALLEYYNSFSGKTSPIYKHTFKKDTNGNYHWYSSEPINF